MITKFILLLPYLLGVISCTGNGIPPALSFEIYTTKETRYEVVALVEKFTTREKLHLNTGYKHPIPDDTEVSMDYIDDAQKIAWMWVSNGNLKNQDHVEVFILTLPSSNENEVCDICKKFEASDEMKKIKEKFKISTIVRNGEWWK